MTSENVRKPGKLISDVGILDIRQVSEDTIDSIDRIENVGMILHSRETAHLVGRIKSVSNIGSAAELSVDFRPIMGEITCDKGYFNSLTEPVHLAVFGQIKVEAEVTVEDIQQGLGGLAVMGQVFCPSHLVGAIHSKLALLKGEVVTYDEASRIEHGNLVLDSVYLSSLGRATNLMVLGSLRLPDILDNGLLDEKIKSLRVHGTVICHEENVSALLKLREPGPGGKVTIIPAGHQYFDRPIRLDGASLASLQNPRLFCRERVLVSDGLDPELLDDHLEALVCEDIVLCPEPLSEVIHRKCDVLQTTVVTYEPPLWLVQDEETLYPSQFDYLQGNQTVVVTGTLRISADLKPELLAERIATVHNMGTIIGSPDQLGAIQSRLGARDGVLLETVQKDDADEVPSSEHTIGNIGYLAL